MACLRMAQSPGELADTTGLSCWLSLSHRPMLCCPEWPSIQVAAASQVKAKEDDAERLFEEAGLHL